MIKAVFSIGHFIFAHWNCPLNVKSSAVAASTLTLERMKVWARNRIFGMRSSVFIPIEVLHKHRSLTIIKRCKQSMKILKVKQFISVFGSVTLCCNSSVFPYKAWLFNFFFSLKALNQIFLKDAGYTEIWLTFSLFKMITYPKRLGTCTQLASRNAVLTSNWAKTVPVISPSASWIMDSLRALSSWWTPSSGDFSGMYWKSGSLSSFSSTTS